MLNRIQRYFKTLLRQVPTGNDGIARITARQIYILPTSTGLIFGSVVLLMLLGSLNYQNNLGLLFTFFLVAIGLLAMHHAWFNLLHLAIQVRGGAAVFVGEMASFIITIRAETQRPHYDISIHADTATSLPTSGVLIAGHQQSTITLTLPAQQRGLLPLNSVRIATHHPMHLFRAWCYISTTATTLIYPQPTPHAPPPETDAGNVNRPQQRRRSSGVEDYLGSRPYRPGDSPRHIDWKAVARERGLVVKQFGSDQGQTLWLDWSQLHLADPELRLSVLARQVLDANHNGVRFGLRLPGGVTEPPAQGAAQVHRCLTHLALFNGR